MYLAKLTTHVTLETTFKPIPSCLEPCKLQLNICWPLTFHIPSGASVSIIVEPHSQPPTQLLIICMKPVCFFNIMLCVVQPTTCTCLKSFVSCPLLARYVCLHSWAPAHPYSWMWGSSPFFTIHMRTRLSLIGCLFDYSLTPRLSPPSSFSSLAVCKNRGRETWVILSHEWYLW